MVSCVRVNGNAAAAAVAKLGRVAACNREPIDLDKVHAVDVEHAPLALGIDDGGLGTGLAAKNEVFLVALDVD